MKTRTRNKVRAESPKSPRKRGRPTGGKYDEKVHIDAVPEEVARSMFGGKPKPKGEWRYLRKKA